jgi:hypothetical protein
MGWDTFSAIFLHKAFGHPDCELVAIQLISCLPPWASQEDGASVVIAKFATLLEIQRKLSETMEQSF